jgi:hypothetical protein
MYKIIPIVFSFFLFGCCTSKDISSINLEDEFVGIWHHNNIPEATLRIYPKENQIYLLKFVNGKDKWEGIGYLNDNQIIAIFRYKNVDDKGFITFTLESGNKMIYTSRNPDGSVRWDSYYIKY